MRMYDIIEKKRDNLELTKEEIEFFVRGYSNGDIPDYQASALIMAIFLNKLSKQELVYLTEAMTKSAKILDLSDIKKEGKYIVDKHSTGGVGDKVSLIVIPIVAALGVDVFKMSGRGLGFTGGTADKIESIKGFDINISLEQACHQIQDIGECLITQSPEIAIADKKNLYAFGDEAFEMHEKAPSNIEVSFPVKYGVIAHFDNMQHLLIEFIRKISRQYKKIAPADYYIAVPTGITEVEKRAFLELIRDSKVRARKIMIINKPVADAVGAGVEVKRL